VYNKGKYYIICIVYNIRPRLSSIYNITQIHLHYIYTYISFFQVHKIKYIELNSTPLATNPIIITSSTPVIWNPIRKYHPLRTSYILQREIEYCTVVSHGSYIYIIPAAENRFSRSSLRSSRGFPLDTVCLCANLCPCLHPLRSPPILWRHRTTAEYGVYAIISKLYYLHVRSVCSYGRHRWLILLMFAYNIRKPHAVRLLQY